MHLYVTVFVVWLKAAHQNTRLRFEKKRQKSSFLSFCLSFFLVTFLLFLFELGQNVISLIPEKLNLKRKKKEKKVDG